MRFAARLAGRGARIALAAMLLVLATLLLPQTAAVAQRPFVDLRGVSLGPADLPRGFAIVEGLTTSEPLQVGQSQDGTDVVGTTLRMELERPRTLEYLQSGPVKVSQMIAHSDDPSRATFSLDAQREYNLRENGYQAANLIVPDDTILCLVRRDGPFIEYRIDSVKNSDTLVSTTATGLPSAINLDSALALARVSLSRYDEQIAGVVAAQPLRAASANAPDASARSLATATPTPAPAAPTPTPGLTPTAQAVPPVTAAAPLKPVAVATAAPAPKSKLPAHFDDRLAQPWSELMSTTATTKSGEKMTAFLLRVVDKTDLKVSIGRLESNVGGELRSVASMDGDKAKIIQSGITINTGVMTERPRVLAAMLAHEMTHAYQQYQQTGKGLPNCLEDEVEAYGVQARVWSAFWGKTERPDDSTWERTNNEIVEVWKDSGDDGLRVLIQQETDTDEHSCIG